MSDLGERSVGRLTFTRGFGWYSFEGMTMEGSESQIHGSIVIKGVARDPKIWHDVFLHIYERRLSFHDIHDPFVEVKIHDLLDIVVEFDDEKKLLYFIEGVVVSVAFPENVLTLNVEKHIFTKYGLKNLDLSR